ncbi:hypothetical protein BG011_008087 [Mortierella polycephala]|uniref:Uncharacterized protein n=1 Tax=Mortierella polycephala TaxID=41804 RepID=A0A9P6U8I2_9FUNG|nr:hypothetical protein BG011_008087 [Mortierella polycephala]
MTDNHRSSTDQQHPTTDPFTDPNPNKNGARQTTAKVVALPLAAAGGAVTEMTRKVKEFVTGQSTKIDTSHSKDSPH